MRWAGRLSQAAQDITAGTFSWAKIQGSGTTTLLGSENVSSLTDTGAGDYTITWMIPYRTASAYAVCMGTSGTTDATTLHFRAFASILATSVQINIRDYNSAALTDADAIHVLANGEF